MMNINTFVAKQSKLIERKFTARVSKFCLSSKNNLGEIKLHFMPDSTGRYMLTTKSVYEVGQTEEYESNGEKKKRFPKYIIPTSANYYDIEGAVKPTEMQLKKLDKLTDLLQQYAELTDKWTTGHAKLDSNATETKMWVKHISTYTKFWAKVAEFKFETTSDKTKQPDTSKLMMITHTSTNFVKNWNTWATVDEDSEISVDEQNKKINESVSREVAESARCVKISTKKASGPGYDVEIKNLSPEKTSVEITEDDVKDAIPLIQEDWDYTNFDDNKVDTLIQRVSKYLSNYVPSEDDESDADEDESDESEEGAVEVDESEGEAETKNPFDTDDDEE